MLAYLDTLIGFTVVMLAMSAVIMIATQMVSALLGSRGTNLRWGLETLFASANLPEGSNVRQLAEDVLTHGMISDSIFSRWGKAGLAAAFLRRFHLASAIHADEMVATLKHLAENRYSGTPLGPAISRLLEEASPAVLRQMRLLEKAAPAAAAAAAAPLVESAGKLEEGFHITMARVSQRFTMQLRLWTVLFSCVLAFGTGTNALRLMRELYSNGAFRESLVGSAAEVEGLADKVLSAGARTPEEAVGAIYGRALRGALESAKVPGAAAPASVASEEAARAWIEANVKDADARKAVLAALPAAMKNELAETAQNAAKVRTIVNQSSFDILRFRWADPWFPEVPGVAVTAALLSLGAPFWYNLLKTQTSLRPGLAARAAQERKSP